VPKAEEGKSSPSRVIRASEIGEYIYCHRAWWLGRVQGVENANRAQMEAGIERHRSHGQAVRRAEILRRAAFVLALLAVGTGALLLASLIGFVR
jgi:CRISPR/Cas system-associated exonuclease Cas4 (RecB family)